MGVIKGKTRNLNAEHPRWCIYQVYILLVSQSVSHTQQAVLYTFLLGNQFRLSKEPLPGH